MAGGRATTSRDIGLAALAPTALSLPFLQRAYLLLPWSLCLPQRDQVGIFPTAMTRGSPQGDSVTPPLSSRDALPLTPPLTNEKNPTTVSQIVGTIERYKRGRHVPTERFMRFRIDKHQYQDLERELSEDEFFRNKLR